MIGSKGQEESGKSKERRFRFYEYSGKREGKRGN